MRSVVPLLKERRATTRGGGKRVFLCGSRRRTLSPLGSLRHPLLFRSQRHFIARRVLHWSAREVPYCDRRFCSNDFIRLLGSGLDSIRRVNLELNLNNHKLYTKSNIGCDSGE